MECGNFQEISSARWIKRNSLQGNRDYICKLLEHFDIKKYNFNVDGYGDLNLTLTKKLTNYLIQMDQDEKCYNLLEENLESNPKQKSRYVLIQKFFGEEIIEDVIRYINKKEGYIRGS